MEHPAVTFKILDPIQPAIWPVLELSQDMSAGRNRTFHVRLHVWHVHKDAVNHPRHA